VHAAFLAAGLVDRAVVFVAPKLAGADGVPLFAGKGPARMADAIQLEGVEIARLGDDVLVQGTPVLSRAAQRRPAMPRRAAPSGQPVA
jgi:diaminohydroxyphosphoribosylaminopyrimidine deaminase/5-amino-6-(5-phosphoribosylamino)uracil reductase